MTRAKIFKTAGHVAEGTSFVAWVLEQINALQPPALLSLAIATIVTIAACRYGVMVVFPWLCRLLRADVEARIRRLEQLREGLSEVERLPGRFYDLADWMLHRLAGGLRWIGTWLFTLASQLTDPKPAMPAPEPLAAATPDPAPAPVAAPRRRRPRKPPAPPHAAAAE